MFQTDRSEKIHGLSPKAMDAMLDYNWPGNIRELENVIKRITILCENNEVEFEDLPEHIQQINPNVHPIDTDILEAKGMSLEKVVKDYEKKLILGALEKSNGVKSKAARLLNIKRTTLVEKIKKQNIA
jgi:DNA-binding NtrC family response regulator